MKPQQPLYLWLKLNARRWLVLLVLLVLPLVVLSLTPQTRPLSEGAERPRLGRVTTGRVFQDSATPSSDPGRRSVRR